MTLKKERVKRARDIRKNLGTDFVLSHRLAKTSFSADFIDLLEKNGYVLQRHVTDQCPFDGGDVGFYTVTKDGVDKGRIPFDCAGILM